MGFELLDDVIHPMYDGIMKIVGKAPGGVLVFGDIEGAKSTVCVDENRLIKVNSFKYRSKYDLLKMYIIVDDSAPIGLGINAVGHVAYNSYRMFDQLELQQIWQEKSCRQVTCIGKSADIKQAINDAINSDIPFLDFHEPDWEGANGRPISVAFSAQYQFPPIFREFKLHSGY